VADSAGVGKAILPLTGSVLIEVSCVLRGASGMGAVGQAKRIQNNLKKGDPRIKCGRLSYPDMNCGSG